MIPCSLFLSFFFHFFVHSLTSVLSISIQEILTSASPYIDARIMVPYTEVDNYCALNDPFKNCSGKLAITFIT